MRPGDGNTGFEPTAWLLIFNVSTGLPWLDGLIPGFFKHVSAVGWVSDAQVWIFYDVSWRRTSLKVLPDKEGSRCYALAQRGNGVLKVAVDVERRGAAMFRAGFWCVPAMKHLIGSRSGALRPDRLWRDLVASGAEVFSNDGIAAGSNGSNRRGKAGGAGCEERGSDSDAGHLAA
jgi:hypothetical protein